KNLDEVRAQISGLDRQRGPVLLQAKREPASDFEDIIPPGRVYCHAYDACVQVSLKGHGELRQQIHIAMSRPRRSSDCAQWHPWLPKTPNLSLSSESVNARRDLAPNRGRLKRFNEPLNVFH